MKRKQRSEIASNARKLAKRYQQRVWWVDAEDLEQEAWVAQLAALRTYNAEEGGFGGYAWRAALYACQRFVLSMSAPVSCRHDPVELIGLHRESLSAIDALPAPESVEEQLDALRHEHLVRERLAEILGGSGAVFALGLLTKEYTPREVAADHSVPIHRVYNAVRSIRDKVVGDKMLYDLWREHG